MTYAVLYRGPEHLWILVSTGGLGTTTADTEGLLSSGGVKGNMLNFDCKGRLASPNPALVKDQLRYISSHLLYSALFRKVLDFIYLFREKGEEEREGEKHQNINVWLPLVCSLLGMWPTTQACALTGNGTSDPLICRLVLNLLSHTRQGQVQVLNLLGQIFS